jgi:hypothetical protein
LVRIIRCPSGVKPDLYTTGSCSGGQVAQYGHSAFTYKQSIMSPLFPLNKPLCPPLFSPKTEEEKEWRPAVDLGAGSETRAQRKARARRNANGDLRSIRVRRRESLPLPVLPGNRDMVRVHKVQIPIRETRAQRAPCSAFVRVIRRTGGPVTVPSLVGRKPGRD